MVYTVTFNPAIDYVVRVDDFETGKLNRTRQELIQIGGKGINVSVLLSRLGVETTALGAAYLAGLAVGYWSSQADVIRNWAVDRTFSPSISPAQRDEKVRGWERAVKRSFDWARE